MAVAQLWMALLVMVRSRVDETVRSAVTQDQAWCHAASEPTDSVTPLLDSATHIVSWSGAVCAVGAWGPALCH